MDQLVVLKNKKLKCHFCGLKKNDSLKYGPKYRLGNIRAHYYCVLLSKDLHQNGRDDEGMLGFLLSDIQNVLHKTVNMICTYCGRGNATITCSGKKCRKYFHLPCGLKNGSLHQFINEFKSYCNKHRPIQNIPSKILDEASKNKAICCICYDLVKIKNKNTLWAPCCLKTWYHRGCVQKLAHSAGYFFKCAACNDEQKFKEWMQRFGIFIPQQDASWELVPNAFEELLYRYDKCDAEICKCPQGRKKNEEFTMWEIVLCRSCGSQGIHKACGNLKFLTPEWECDGCESVTKNLKTATRNTGRAPKPQESSSMLLRLADVSQKKRRRGSEDLESFVLDKRKKCRMSLVQDEEEEEEEVEIDVESTEETTKEKGMQAEVNEDGEDDDDDDEDIPEVIGSVQRWTKNKTNVKEVLGPIKPGTLSYKLGSIEEIMRNIPTIAKRTKRGKPTEIDFVELTDSDEDKPDSDIELIEERKTPEDNDDDVQVIEERKAQSLQSSSSVFHYRVQKGVHVERRAISTTHILHLRRVILKPRKQRPSRRADVNVNLTEEPNEDDVMVILEKETRKNGGD